MNGPFREGRVHVLADKCAACVLRPHDVADAVERQAAITCHLNADSPAVCRTFFDKYSARVAGLSLAQTLGIVEYDGVPSPRGATVSDDVREWTFPEVGDRRLADRDYWHVWRYDGTHTPAEVATVGDLIAGPTRIEWLPNPELVGFVYLGAFDHYPEELDG
jgi:hypothetical protein